MIGTVIAHFKILQLIGVGGMGVVYKAHDTILDRDVALKFLHPRITARNEYKVRLLNEAKLAGSLNHSNICTVHEVREYQGQQYIVMEFVEGITLSELIKKGPLELNTVVDYAHQIGDGLNEAHKHGIIHRDIKSENIIVTNKNQIKIMDFGVAKADGSSTLPRSLYTFGTVSYMSPEQILNIDADARADIYSFGVVVYEMLAGELPFKGDSDPAITFSIINDTPQPITDYRSNLAPKFVNIINRSLEKDREDRYSSADEILLDLEHVKRNLNGDDRSDERPPAGRDA
ncbi:hypothetical protein BVY01_01890, partial [bacterium I07]